MNLDLRACGATDLQVSPITLGASYLGASWKTVDPVDVGVALLEAPFAVVDTSNNYTDGASETALGRALTTRGGLLPHHHIVTKTDADKEGRFDRDQVWRSFEESTERLGLERFPLVHLHDPFTVTFEEAMAPGGAVQGMLELREQGLAGAIGIAVGDLDLELRYIGTGAFDAVLTHNHYTLADRSAEALIDEANARGMGVFNAAIYGGGILAGNGTQYAYREASPEFHAWLAKVSALCESWGIRVPVAALHFSLRHPGIHSTVVGVGSRERIEELVGFYRTEVPEDFWPALEELGTPSRLHA